MKFENGKSYVFSKELYINDNDLDMNNKACKFAVETWVEECDGKPVQFANDFIGYCYDYFIISDWCKEAE